jgi:uncharacterized RDD family membrane protein YckC
MASDGKWYPPESAPGYQQPAPQMPTYGAMPQSNVTYMAVPSDPLGRPYASWGTRVGASLIDALVVIIPVAIIAALSYSSATYQYGIETRTAHFGGGFYLSLLIPFLYQFLMLGAKGQTLGNMAVKTKVVDMNGATVTYGRAAGRVGADLGLGLVSSFTFGLLGLLDILWPLWDQKNQTLHDKIAQTLVVKVG